MNVMEAIKKRRSIRKYTDEEVDKETLVELCRAGLASPSARNGRPWELIIVQKKDMLAQLSLVRKPWLMLRGASAAIVIAGQEGKYLQQDCAAAAENILLAAESFGLGACWLGLYPNMQEVETVHKLMCLPEGILPVVIISVGYPKPNHSELKRVLDENKIHFEYFGGNV